MMSQGNVFILSLGQGTLISANYAPVVGNDQLKNCVYSYIQGESLIPQPHALSPTYGYSSALKLARAPIHYL